MQVFNSKVISENSGRFTYIEVPFDAKKTFGKPKGTIFVRGTINNISYRKESKCERSEHLVSPDKIATDRRSGALGGAIFASPNIPYRGRLLSRGGGKQVMRLDKTLQASIGFSGKEMSVNVTMSVDEIDTFDKNVKQPFLCSSDTNVITAIYERRSIRKFTSESVSEVQLNTILQAGLCAPSAKNKKPLHLVVIKDREILSKLSIENANAKMLSNAAYGIVVCGDKNVEGTKEFLYADCAAATQNILLCIHGLGLGGVWCGVASNSVWYKLLADILKLPLKVEPFSVVALGYSDEKKISDTAWDAGKIHFDIW